MPTYQYACKECGHAFDQAQSFSDDALTECPECDGRLRKVFNAVGVVFKGSGFYRTDSRAKASSGETSSSGESKSESKRESSSGESTAASKKESKSGSNGDSSSGSSSASSSSTSTKSPQPTAG